MKKNDYLKEFTQTITSLIRKYDRHRVFDDFLTMGICSYHSTNIKSKCQETDEQNEALYFNTIEKYKPQELEIFSKLLGVLQLSIYDTPYSDLLGEFFTLHITKGENGQFFTPEHICDLMSKLNSPEPQTGQRVLDPACGSGRMLLSFAKDNPDNYFFGSDISSTCAKMTTLNFFLNGLKGEVTHMNSLSMEWFTGWQINMNDIGIMPIEKEQSIIWSAPPTHKNKNKTKSKTSDQLSLF